jgi:hypothetical protein
VVSSTVLQKEFTDCRRDMSILARSFTQGHNEFAGLANGNPLACLCVCERVAQTRLKEGRHDPIDANFTDAGG